jgi:hypothetical protein
MKDYKDLPVCQLADKLRVMIMELFLGGDGLEKDSPERYFPPS